jgi:Lon protease-like protein
MVNDALAGSRLIGIIQPESDPGNELERPAPARPGLFRVDCAGRITAFAETEDERVVLTLTGICRFRLMGEVTVTTPYRQVRADYAPFAGDLTSGLGEDAVNRQGLLTAFRSYLDAKGLKADWAEVAAATNEQLVNTLAMLAPYDPPEKQALLEAPDLRTRAEVLIALTEMNLARSGSGAGHQLQ